MTRVVLITGATDGIGLALARRYHSQGARLALVGRRALAELEDPLFTSETYCAVDLAGVDAADQIERWLVDRGFAGLDILINNAGTGYVGTLTGQDEASIRHIEAVNLRAPLRLTHRLLPRVERSRGSIVFIGSLAGTMPGPRYAVYSATKAALDAFVRSFQVELAAGGSQARAIVIHPGATRTGIHAKTGLSLAEMDLTKFAPADEVAAQIQGQIEGQRRTSGAGFLNNLAYQSLRRWPEPVEWFMQREHRRRREPKPGGHCVITGGADGIGRALVLAFGKAGFRITGLDRDRERAIRTQAALQNLGGRGRFLITDLSDPAQVERSANALAERPPADVIIHNAGISAVGLFAELPLDAQLRVLDINFLAPLLLSRHLLANRSLAADGRHVFIASLACFAGYPGAAVYAASKAGLASFARSLAVDLAPDGAHVLTVYPGPTRTAHARRYSPDNRREARRMPPEQLAQQILASVQRDRRQLIPGAGNRSIALVGRFFPNIADGIMRKTVLEKLLEQPEKLNE